MSTEEVSKEKAEQAGAGSIFISVDSSKRSSALILKESGTTLIGNNPSSGASVDESGVTFQGKIAFTSVGSNITRGQYSENNNSAKPYTYTETVSFEGISAEAAYTAAGLSATEIKSISNSGKIPITTDTASGPLPHVHTINNFKHIHKIEPAYLYRSSPLFSSLGSFVKSFKSFLST
jgi:hypothetical protein